jgi:hypothetical protein
MKNPAAGTISQWAGLMLPMCAFNLDNVKTTPEEFYMKAAFDVPFVSAHIELTSGDAIRVVWARCGDSLCVVLGGARNARACTSVFEGWKSPQDPVLIDGTHAWFDSQANEIITRIITPNLPGCADLHIVGYSAGGCIGEYIALKIGAVKPTFPIYLQLFGSPKSMSYALSYKAIILCARYQCWYLSDDPIPTLPVQSDTDSRVAWVIGSRHVRRWDSFWRAVKGAELQGVNTWGLSIGGSQAAAFSLSNIVSFYLQQNVDRSSPHHVETYNSRFAAALAVVPVPVQQPDVPSPAPRLPSVTIATQQEAAVERVFNQIQHEQIVRPVDVPPRFRVLAVRRGKIWSVEFAGQQVGISPSKKHARQTARTLNAFLDSYLTIAVADPAAMLDQLNGFFQAASDPSSGVVPTMNTTVVP